MDELDIDALERHPLDGEEPNDFMYWAERQDAIIARLKSAERVEAAARDFPVPACGWFSCHQARHDLRAALAAVPAEEER